MNKTPRTDGARYDVYAESDGIGAWIDIDANPSGKWVEFEFAENLERDLAECLATLESVRDYLYERNCLCFYGAEFACARCRMLADVETTLKNCKP